MNNVLRICTMIVLALPAHPAPMGIIVLNAANWEAGRLPSDWQVKITHGKPDVSVCADSGNSCVRLKSLKSSFGLERGVDIDPARLPYLSWKWKVTQIPPGADFRQASRDDQAAQVLVAFADRRVITYIWDSTAPKGTAQSASAIPLVHIYAVVCQSGMAEANRWISEVHNLAADYEKAYGRPAPHVKGIRLQINSQHTGTSAESYFQEVAFRNGPE